jgi:hypothetical protein
MRLLLRLLALPLLLPFGAAAQLITGPLPADPARAATANAPAANTAAQRTTALALPFFDDFTTPLEGPPNDTRWLGATITYPNQGTTSRYLGGGSYVSNRFAVNPLTRGTLTLDGLRSNGLPYSPSQATAYGQTDTLTSQVIDLSGLGAASNVYLSFAWQAGSVVGTPTASSGSTPVSLTLELLDNTGRWQAAWTYNSVGATTRFKQQILAINQAAYLHNAFQFRFRSSGSRTLSTDLFGLDYIYLNSNRAANDTTFQDIATSRGLGSPLRTYTSMPVWQYAAAASSGTSPLNPALTTTLNSLTAPLTTPTPVNWVGTVRELTPGGAATATWLSGGRPIAAAARQELVQGDATTAPLAVAGTAARRFRYQLAVRTNETNPLTLPNDTISRDLELSTYYAYDDGTAESGIGIPASNTNPTSYLALGFTTSQDDYVRSVRVAPVFNNIPLAAGGENGENRPITVAVWADNNGKPANTPLATATTTLINSPATAQTFVEVPFAAPVPVKGRFYVGYGQISNGRFLLYGYDLNNQLPANSLFLNTQATTTGDPWTAQSLAGAPMLRPVMNQTVLATRGQQALSAAFTLFPNPAFTGTTVAVDGPKFSRAALLDVLGRPVWQQPAAEAGQPSLRLPAGLPPGVYLVQLTLPDGSTATRRLSLH